MSANRPFYYLWEKSITTSGEADSMFFTESSSNNQININEQQNNIDEEKEFDESELLPYTPNSVDRSSVGSIPWADDAIKQNLQDWERIERLLSAEEEPLPEETELTQEIHEWQEKFPQLLNNKTKGKTKTKTFKVQQSFDSNRTNLDDSFDSLSNISLDYSDNDLEDGFATPKLTKPYQTLRQNNKTPVTNQRKSSIVDLAQQLSKNLRISSVPLTWRQRQKVRSTNFLGQNEPSTTSTHSPQLVPLPPPRRHSPTYNSLIIAPAQARLRNLQFNNESEVVNKNRMPPLLNVLESKRRFRGLANNRSFVQLTQLQQTKSAALMQHTTRAPKRSQPTAWHVPLAAAAIGNRFLSNRNSIVLPAINLRRIQEHRTTDAPSSASSGSFLSPGGAISLQEPAYYLQQQYMMSTPKNYSNGFLSTTPSTSGRSISAAVQHPRVEVSAFYLPYSAATKFKSFNKI